MPLTLGTRLGPHEATVLIDSGGMGAAYAHRNRYVNPRPACFLHGGSWASCTQPQRWPQLAERLAQEHLLLSYNRIFPLRAFLASAGLCEVAL